MFVLFIAMIFALYYHASIETGSTLPASELLAIVTLPRLAAGLVYLLMTRVTLRMLATPGAPKAMAWMDRLGRLYHLVILLLFVSDIRMGLLATLRDMLGGNRVLVDEILIFIPTLLMILWQWVCYYPIDRRLREASLMRRLDAGLPAFDLCTPGQYVLNQLRHQVLVVLIPLLALYGWSEIVDRLPASITHAGQWDITLLYSLGGAGLLLTLSPVMLRYLWDTQPLPAGPLRSTLENLCRTYGVKVRQLLLWKTYGTLINAAVMGMIWRIRYIMLTDALLENMSQLQVEAVMAHEVAHLRRRHIIWLVVAAAAILVALQSLSIILLKLYMHAPPLPGSFGQLQEILVDEILFGRIVVIASMVGWFLIFGWVSRRFERQADTFAVQHLSMQYGRQLDPSLGLVVDHHSAATMINALQQLANLNHIPVHRNTWRHGSIRWRQRYLESIIGQPLHQLAIDDHIFWIKAAALLILAGGAFFELYRLGMIA